MPSVSKFVEQTYVSCIVGEYVNGTATLESNLAFS